jgi:hypothetical protein
MAAVFKEYTTEELSYVALSFLWAKGFTTKDIRKEMFSLYGGKCLSRKTVPLLWQTFC